MTYRSPREATNRLLEMVEEGILDRDTVISACIYYMSEDEVRDMCESNEFFEHEEEEEEVANTITYTLPAYWASYLINGDASGLEEGEQEQIDAFLEHEGLSDPLNCGEESWFAKTNDANSIGGNVTEYVFPRP